MLALTWWGWAGCGAAGLIAIVALLFGARRSWRTGIRQELVDHLRRTAPEFAITAIHPDRLELTVPGAAPGEGATFYLDRFYSQIVSAPAGDGPDAKAAREEIYRVVAASLREGATGLESLDAEAERANVMPRLVTDAALAALRSQVVAGGKALPSLPSGVPGLSIVFVLDREASVAYLTGDLLAELKLTPDEALDVGRDNLARTFGRDVVRSAVGSRDINVIKSCDSFDAARLLLVPGYLDAGESLVALIPDRDTLVLTTAPADGDWAGLRKLARAAAGDPLWAEPLIVTSTGIAKAA